jgi:hypothetical protein
MLDTQVVYVQLISIYLETRTGPIWRVDTSGRGENIRKRGQRVNMVEIFSTHVCKWKNETS